MAEILAAVAGKEVDPVGFQYRERILDLIETGVDVFGERWEGREKSELGWVLFA